MNNMLDPAFREQLHFVSKNVQWYLGIGDVAEATGVSQSQLRYWEQKGYIESKKEHSQNRKYTYGMLIKVFVIKYYMDQGFTLAAAAKKAAAHKETTELLKHFILDRFEGVKTVDGFPAIDLGYLDSAQSERLLAVVKEDHTDFKIIPTSEA
ncbi:MerR family transcriptional regulator [Secundilactobacillus paracollinoides]|uniref:MerR family transcriptional regulator n=1 Tax=Secundilactobacillus paracollinoides TaxID=240427 RepID=UPI000AABFA0C|nr:MerR family transcriptional regulator [Secundilactobacillus paracollinoides]